jgi:hypothetical protein
MLFLSCFGRGDVRLKTRYESTGPTPTVHSADTLASISGMHHSNHPQSNNLKITTPHCMTGPLLSVFRPERKTATLGPPSQPHNLRKVE